MPDRPCVRWPFRLKSKYDRNSRHFIRPDRSEFASMLKLTKKADYGLMAMKHLAEHVAQGACSAKDVAEAYGIPQEALAKILQRLAKVGLVRSQHGTHGGYTLARAPELIFPFERIKALDCPPLLSACVTGCGRFEQTEPVA